jgi:hypothetical protein
MNADRHQQHCVERVPPKFCKELEERRAEFLTLMTGIEEMRERRLEAAVLLCRSMFIYFLQRKGCAKWRTIGGDQAHLRGKLVLPGSAHDPGGGLFMPNSIERRNPRLDVPDIVFENLYQLFDGYSWNMDAAQGGQADEITPDALGAIFEKHVNRKAFGAYYTRPEIAERLCAQTIHKLILDRANSLAAPGARRYETIEDLLLNLDASLSRRLLDEVLPDLKLLDPACGSGEFLVAALKTLFNVYRAIIVRVERLGDQDLKTKFEELRAEQGSLDYFIKKRIITRNLFGIDIMEEATEVVKLRLFLSLVASAQGAEQPPPLESLPEIDFNIRAGNALIGIVRLDESEGDKTRVRGASSPREAVIALNEILLREFAEMGIRFEQATWDETRSNVGRPEKRPVTLEDIEALRPFHWGYEFAPVLEGGGFDAIITNPPWEIFKPVAKEFCCEVDPTIERRGTSIKEFEKRLAGLLEEREIRDQYIEYLSRFPHTSAYFRSAKEYENQSALVGGKRQGMDINLYKLFLERSFNLLRAGGECGIVLPSGIYSDLGTKRLREMLFDGSRITGLFGFENRKAIFKGVDSRFKFVVLTFSKGGTTRRFPAAFMRHEVGELERFPSHDDLRVDVRLVRRLSPASLSIIEFQNMMDVSIAQKMARFPLLGAPLQETWNLALTREFDMTNDSRLFEPKSARGRLPLYEGRMIRHFAHAQAAPRYWIDERRARAKLLSPRVKRIKKLLAEAGLDDSFDESRIEPAFNHYRLGLRAVTGATNARALVVTALPRRVLAGNSLVVSRPFADRIIDDAWTEQSSYSGRQLLACVALMSSFVCDWFVRKKILTNMNMFYVNEIPVPRLGEEDAAFAPLVERAAHLICTAPEFEDLEREAGLPGHTGGVTGPQERARLRAELDGMIARLYGLTEEEFAHILAAFPLVSREVKEAALAEFRRG